MVVRIRLQRFGRRGQPFYRVVVADARAPRDGKFIEIVRSVFCGLVGLAFGSTDFPFLFLSTKIIKEVVPSDKRAQQIDSPHSRRRRL